VKLEPFSLPENAVWVSIWMVWLQISDKANFLCSQWAEGSSDLSRRASA